jgi:hypothetical protein
VHAALAENWVTYTYWSRANHRFQATAVELYDASPRNLSALQLVLGGGNATMSSYEPVQLEVRAGAAAPVLSVMPPTSQGCGHGLSG